MNADLNPTYISIFLGELVFGWAYNSLIDLLSRKKALDPYISYAVALGVAVTVAIPTLVFGLFDWALLMLGSFICSGIPMIIGSMRRNYETTKAARQKKRKTISGAAARTRDDVVMGLVLMADQVANNEADAAKLVHELHQNIGILKGM